MFRSIVVGTDGSAGAEQVVRTAIGLARAHGAALHLVCAYAERAPAASVAALLGGTAGGDPAELQREAERSLAHLARDARRVGVERVDTYACPGSAANSLLEVAGAQRADLLVVGSRGMTGARRGLGTVPNRVSHAAACNVLIVKTD